jgi:hypothetical protein
MKNQDQDIKVGRAAMVALRTSTSVLAVAALLVGLLLSESSSGASTTLLAVGIGLAVVALGLAIATGVFQRMTLGSSIIIAVVVVLVGLVLIDLTNG